MSKVQKKDPYSSLKIKEFRWFLAMRLAIVLAWSMQFIIVEWEVYKITKDPWSLGLIGLMEVIPAITLALFAGHIVDKNEKRKMLLGCYTGLFVLSFLLTNLISPFFTSTKILYGIYVLVFLGGVARAFIFPSIFSLLGLIVPNSEKSNAAAWSSSTWQISATIGPALAGFLIGWIGVYGAMWIVLLCILIGLLALFQIAPKPILNAQKKETVYESLKEGLVFVFSNKTILNAISLDMFAVLFGGAVALLPIFATDILKVGSEGFGILRAAPAIGGLITMLLATHFDLNHRAGKKLLWAIFGFGICIIVFGLSTHFWLSVIALFLSGVTDGISVVIRSTILQLYTPDTMRGRVSSVNSIFVGSSNELGAFESGFTSKLMGTVNAVVFGGIMTLIVVGSMALSSSKFRNLDIDK
ncbi:MFS transporter [Flavobacterium oreochromis]|uniref:MFS transporter n=2 Tax=Flavobacterium TaxID=237 RepID=A0A246GC13_9FLAO|nr:MFS transporter [Flavobacterium oreochromis]OWP74578.1 MFS transporter [Flavobacterium oreochromis]OWP78407.1 MFS transporter [Flavobacterium oreochromis]POR17703.1 MFS transporter [Flavobacterium columnare]